MDHQDKRNRWRELIAVLFGDAKQVDIAAETGISQPWINQIAGGRVPGRDVLVKLLDWGSPPREVRNELMVLAGYWSAGEAWREGLTEIGQETGQEILLDLEEIPGYDWTPERVERALSRIRERAVERAQTSQSEDPRNPFSHPGTGGEARDLSEDHGRKGGSASSLCGVA